MLQESIAFVSPYLSADKSTHRPVLLLEDVSRCSSASRTSTSAPTTLASNSRSSSSATLASGPAGHAVRGGRQSSATSGANSAGSLKSDRKRSGKQTLVPSEDEVDAEASAAEHADVDADVDFDNRSRSPKRGNTRVDAKANANAKPNARTIASSKKPKKNNMGDDQRA
jgi:hypothetical protein